MVLVKKTVKAGGVDLRIDSHVYVRPSFDRKVTLRYVILWDGQESDSVTEHDIAAKEKKHRSEHSSLFLARAACDALVQGKSRGILKVLMTVVPDK